MERIARCWHELGDRRGVLLVQLPPDFGRDDARLDYFLAALPEWIGTCVEFRHPSWDHPEVYALLERHGAAYCVMSGAGLPCILRATAPFVYVRLHGPDHEHLYGGSYSDEELGWWADRIREWAGGRQGRLSPISTTTAAATPCGTPPRCAGCWVTPEQAGHPALLPVPANPGERSGVIPGPGYSVSAVITIAVRTFCGVLGMGADFT